MKIVDSRIAMASARGQRELQHREESLTVRQGDRQVSLQRSNTEVRDEGMVSLIRDDRAQAHQGRGDRVEISVAAREAAREATVVEGADKPEAVGEVKDDDTKASLEPRYAILATLLEKLTGRKVVLFDADKLRSDQPAPPAQGEGGESPARPAESVGDDFGVAYSARTIRAEFESTRFEAAGVVRTADGREIDIEMELNLSRSFVEMSAIDVAIGNARLKDPLVINLEAGSAELESERFVFDIDASGEPQSLARLASGSGFLALDRDGSGTIDDGTELFGALSGDGFADLAAHDQDENGWIDENDAVFQQLRVWIGAGSEGEQLRTLSSLGIGAIYLGKAETEFSLKDRENALLGQLRSTGLYLHESGRAGTVQQIDLAV
ncbi:MAG: hypothetical protein ACLFSG_05850 [Halothiobacillaceae bacterium]